MDHDERPADPGAERIGSDHDERPARPGALVGTGWVEDHIGDPGVALVECDEDTSAYECGHIPGAVSLDWREDLRDRPRRDVVSAARLAELLGRRGLRTDQRIVLYGGNGNRFAAYAYWLFRMRGVSDVALCDGGRSKWEAEGRPLTTARTDLRPAVYETGTPRRGIRARRDDVTAASVAGRSVLVDVRSPEEYRGEMLSPPHLGNERAQVAGHVPGARNVPWSWATADDGAFRPIAELRRLYRAAGVAPDRDVIVYCRIGERSAHTWFVLSELLGHQRVRNYDGSWTEYGSLVGVPVEVGDAPASGARRRPGDTRGPSPVRTDGEDARRG